MRPKRRNSRGVNLNIRSHFYPLMDKMAVFMDKQYPVKPLLAFDVADDAANTHNVTCPFDRRQSVGSVQWTTKEQATKALDAAWNAFRAGKPRRLPNVLPCCAVWLT